VRAEREGAAGASPRLPRLWPLAVGAVAVVVGLALLSALLRPRRAGSGDEPENSPARVTVERAPLRREPATRAPSAVTLPRGASVTVRKERGRWLEVRTEKGEEGFLPAEVVERDLEREARERRAKTILAFPAVHGVVAEDADILLAPFPAAPRAGRLRKGDVIAIHSVDHTYFAFRDREAGLAFVSSADVDLVPRDPSHPSIVPEKVRTLRNVTVADLALPEPEEEALGQMAGEEGLAADEDAEPALAPPGEVLEPAVLLSKVDPVYPEGARRAGVEGTVLLEVAIDASGRVTDVVVLRGLPFGVSQSAVEAVRRWHYRPARGPAGPVASRKTARILFTLGR